MKKKVWIIGRIEGLDNYEILDNFKEIQERLESEGYEVVHILSMFANTGLNFNEHCKRDIVSLCSCDVACVDHNWIESFKAMSEVQVAQDLNMEIIDADTFRPFTVRMEKMPVKTNKAINAEDIQVFGTDDEQIN